MATHLYLLILPLVFSNCLHMVVVKKDWVPILAQPLAQPLFGANKTWRGLLLLPFFNALFLALVNVWLDLYSLPAALFLGAVLGLAYMLFELPNSFLKRRMGIPAGQSAIQHRWFFTLLDKADSAFGVCLVYYLLTETPWWHVAVLFFLSSSTHMLFSWLLVSVHYKKSF